MKKRYKIKKDVYLYLAVIVVIIIGIYKGITEYKTYKYHFWFIKIHNKKCYVRKKYIRISAAIYW